MTRQASADSPFAVHTLWLNRPFLDACGRACRNWQQEVSRFVAARLECDGELGRRLLGCGTWNEAVMLQQEWAGRAVQDYLEEANRLASLASTMNAELWACASAVGGETGAAAVTERRSHAA